MLTPLADKMAQVVRWDGWRNLYTGLGNALRDKMMHTEFIGSARLSETTLEQLYHEDDMVALLCDTLPEEMLRKGFDVKIEEDDDADKSDDDVHEMEEAVAKACEDLEVIPKFIDAMVWARLYGGAVILPVLRDGVDIEGLKEPLREDSIEEIESLNVVECPYLTPKDWYDDPAEKNYGKPKTYTITPTGGSGIPKQTSYEIHESRMIIFEATRVSARRRLQNRGFSDSVVQRSYDTIRAFATGWQSAGHLLTDSHQAVFKIEGLIDMIASGDTEAINQRMGLVEMGRSVARALVIDADKESFDRQATNFTGLADILKMFILRTSSSFRTPATILMGQSPAGENATGEADFRWFYDKTETYRQHYLKPKLRRFIQLLLKSKKGPTKGVEPDSWAIHFRPLQTMTPAEEAELRNKQADTDVKYIEKEVLLPEEVALSRFKVDGWNAETIVDLDLRAEMLDLEKEKELDRIKNPPPPPPQFAPPGAPPAPGEQPPPAPGQEPPPPEGGGQQPPPPKAKPPAGQPKRAGV